MKVKKTEIPLQLRSVVIIFQEFTFKFLLHTDNESDSLISLCHSGGSKLFSSRATFLNTDEAEGRSRAGRGPVEGRSRAGRGPVEGRSRAGRGPVEGRTLGLNTVND
ncbi:hypothetical protein NL108_001024 [Boleophthalmus pectinirostris]|nr:hypothetical protein NL108_001024 [Boleophthalmus pectinirostris]